MPQPFRVSSSVLRRNLSLLSLRSTGCHGPPLFVTSVSHTHLPVYKPAEYLMKMSSTTREARGGGRRENARETGRKPLRGKDKREKRREEGARERGSEGARERGREGVGREEVRERGREGATRGSEGAMERGRGSEGAREARERGSEGARERRREGEREIRNEGARGLRHAKQLPGRGRGHASLVEQHASRL